jgi:hypothetical protein
MTTVGRLLAPSSFDAFGRERVSSPRNIFDHKQVFDNGVPLFFVEDAVGAGAIFTYDQINARTILTCGTTAAGRATRQTKRYFNYQSGKSMLYAITFNLHGAEANCEKRVGIFDNTNGVYLALPATNIPAFFVRSSSGAGTVSAVQGAWNIDNFDGTGPSGVTMDLNKGQILAIDFQWLAMGVVRCGFWSGNILYYAHEFYTANVGTFVYTSSPNYPIRWEIVGTGVNPASPTLDAICCSVTSEGGQEAVGIQRAFARTTGAVIGAGVTTALLSIRLKAGYERATIFPTGFFAAATTATARGSIELVLNPTLAGATFALPQANSAIEVDIAATTAVGGHVIAAGSIGQDAGSVQLAFADEPAATLASSFTGAVRDHLTLRLTSIALDTWIASINWRELL